MTNHEPNYDVVLSFAEENNLFMVYKKKKIYSIQYVKNCEAFKYIVTFHTGFRTHILNSAIDHRT